MLWPILVSPEHSDFDPEAHVAASTGSYYYLTSYIPGIANLQTQSNLHILNYSQGWCISLILAYAYALQSLDLAWVPHLGSWPSLVSSTQATPNYQDLIMTHILPVCSAQLHLLLPDLGLCHNQPPGPT